MKKYRVYFAIMEKKMWCEVEATSQSEAIRAVEDKLEFHKVELVKSPTMSLSVFEQLKNMFG